MAGRRWVGNLIRAAAVATVVAAVVQELQKTEEERTWHGTVFGFVPYDFRMPTLERIRAAYWNPEDPRILTPRVVGIGWGINIPSLVRTMQQVVYQLRDAISCR
ncbi:MAG: DUF5808 domain-containing protein [Bacteroidetes bacterium]|nr:DUF5808 domain-containing protein [Bacteroidota bacterium]MCL5025124.1 DUF5808 domain-containing protein [Chloroflexota bacterium]